MERRMNKQNRQLEDAAAKSLFTKGHHGILAVNGDNGYPYAVPVNYVYLNDKIYIHSAKYGYKIEALQKDQKVCFTAIISAKVLPDKFTAAYESIIATGDVEFVTDQEEKMTALTAFIDNFSADFKENGMKFIAGAFAKTEVLAIKVQSLTGKASMHNQK